MMAETLTLTYSGREAADSEATLRLEQMPVATTAVTLDDLEQMMAMVRGGTSATAYRQPTCPVTVIAGEVRVPLTVWVWPSDLALDYSLSFAAGVPDARVQIEQEREFDLVIDFDTTIALPFFCRTIELIWSDLPCWDQFGNEVPRPELTATPTALQVSAEILGVVRVRCLAIGYAHPVTVTFAKGLDSKILDIKNTVTASWSAGVATLDLQYPACAADLLAACEDGELVRERVIGQFTDEEDRIPVVYYNDCTGSVLAVRYELP